MSKKAASWAAAALTLLVTLLLGAVLLRPVLASREDGPTDSPSNGVTVIEGAGPVGDEHYEGDEDDHDGWNDDNEGDDDAWEDENEDADEHDENDD